MTGETIMDSQIIENQGQEEAVFRQKEGQSSVGQGGIPSHLPVRKSQIQIADSAG